MRWVKVDLDGTPRRYLLFQRHHAARPYRLVKDARARRLESVASSEFFFDLDTGALAKLKGDKHARSGRFFRWLFRDYLDKRLFFQFEARKEIRSKRIVQAAGLATPECVAWGVSLNPRNPLGSLLLMDHVEDAVTGAHYFSRLPEADRPAFLSRLCDDLMRLARAGYVHRDLHMNNFLCRPSGALIWVDTHVRPLPRGRRAGWRAMVRSISHRGLLDESYRDALHREMKRRWREG